MAERFSLDPDGAAAAGKLLREAGESLLEAHRELVVKLEQYDGCWGDDQIGNAFAKNYVPAADGLRDSFDGLADNTVDVGRYIEQAVDVFVQIDDDAAERIDSAVADEVTAWSKS